MNYAALDGRAHSLTWLLFTGYEYSSGFVMAMSELRISGVRGVPPSMTRSDGTVSVRFVLNMLYVCVIGCLGKVHVSASLTF